MSRYRVNTVPPQTGVGYLSSPPKKSTQQGGQVHDASKEVEWLDDFGKDLDDVKFAPVQIKDKFALSLFLLQIFVLIVLFSFIWSQNEQLQVIDTSIDKPTALKIFSSCCAVAVLSSTLWLVILKSCIKRAIVMTLALTSVVLIAISVTAAHHGQVGWALFWGIVLGIFVFYFYLIRKRIPFATYILKSAINIAFRFPSTIAVAYGAMVVQMCWMVFWALCYMVIWPYFGNNPFIGFALLVSLFWTSQVITNVVHVTVAGTTSYWYFCYDCMPKNPTSRSLKRTLTVSLGSISMGSLITSIVKTVRVILEGLRRSNDGNPSFTVIMAGVTLKWVESYVSSTPMTLGTTSLGVLTSGTISSSFWPRHLTVPCLHRRS